MRPDHLVDFESDLGNRSCALGAVTMSSTGSVPFISALCVLCLHSLPPILPKEDMHLFRFSLSFLNYLIISTGVQTGQGNKAYATLDFKVLRYYSFFLLMGKMESRFLIRILDVDGRRCLVHEKGRGVAT